MFMVHVTEASQHTCPVSLDFRYMYSTVVPTKSGSTSDVIVYYCYVKLNLYTPLELTRIDKSLLYYMNMSPFERKTLHLITLLAISMSECLVANKMLYCIILILSILSPC